MFRLQDAPNEILDQILSSLSTKDLAAMSKVSHLFHHLSQPLLYHNLRFPCFWPSFTSSSPFQLALRTFINERRPKTLASLVRLLTLRLDWAWPASTAASTIAFSSAPAADIELCSYPLDTYGAQLLAFLHLLPNLTCLQMDSCGDDRGTGYIEFMDALKESTLPLGLQNIREFRSVAEEENTGVTPTVLIALMTLPSIRTIIVSITEGTRLPGTFIIDATRAVGTSHVRDLQLVSGNIRLDSLAAVLKVPCHLRSFRCAAVDAQTGFDLTGYGDALAPVQATLEDLRIECDLTGERHHFTNEAGIKATIGTLREWNALKKLECSLTSLLGWEVSDSPPLALADVLPLGLTSLRIVGDCHWDAVQVLDHVVGLLEDCQNKIRALQILSVEVQLTDLMHGRLARACEQAHVLFVRGVHLSH